MTKEVSNFKNKKELRERILALLRNQKEEDRLIKSEKISKKLFSLKEMQKAKVILFYASFDGEVDTLNMIKQAQKLGKKITLPRIFKRERKIVPILIEQLKHLEEGPYGVMQPKESVENILDTTTLDMVIVPGVVFDKKNNRLGRGGGYYDRFLQNLPQDIPTIGLAFDFQIVDHLPHLEPHDITVTRVLSN